MVNMLKNYNNKKIEIINNITIKEYTKTKILNKKIIIKIIIK